MYYKRYQSLKGFCPALVKEEIGQVQTMWLLLHSFSNNKPLYFNKIFLLAFKKDTVKDIKLDTFFALI